jgi:hypothetical protein
MNSPIELLTLQRELKKLISVLQEDPESIWIAHFDACLKETNNMIERGNNSSRHARKISKAVLSVYGGMGSFQDYVLPPNKFGLSVSSRAVWEAATSLKESRL